MKSIFKTKIEPTLKIVSFREFATEVVPAIIREQPSFKFTDGWCLGEIERITLDRGIDTLMGGGDNNYHYTELDPDTKVHITTTGFRVSQDKLQFILVLPTKALGNFRTLAELAAYQKENRFHMLIDCKFNESGDMAWIFEKTKKGIITHVLTAFEDFYTDPTVNLNKQPVHFLRSGSIQIDLQLSQLDQYTSGEGIFTFMSPPSWNAWEGIFKRL